MNGQILVYLSDLIFGFVEAVLALRIALKLLGANASAPFVNWVYETTKPLIAPFAGMFPTPVLNNGFVVEISTLFALLAYMLAAYLINEVIMFVGHLRNRYYQEDDAQEEIETHKAHRLSLTPSKR